MGDMADYYSAREEDAHLMDGLWNLKHKHTSNQISVPAFTWWVERSGKKIKVSQMADSHLKNSIAMIKRNSWRKWRASWLKPLEEEVKRRTKLKT